MVYRLNFDGSLASERKRIALEQVRKTLGELGDDGLDVHERVHQFRKRAKKIRALARLFRPVDEDWYQSENAWFRDLARRYSDLRDAQAATETLDRVTDYFSCQLAPRGFQEIRAQLSRYRAECRCRDSAGEHLPVLRRTMEDALARIDAWPEADIALENLVAGFGKTYNRGRKAMQNLEQDAPAARWHEWRKRVKYHRYHCKLLRGLWPPVIDSWRGELARLSSLLGDDHDLAELAALLGAQEGPGPERAVQALQGLMLQRSRSLRLAALPLGRRLFLDGPGVMKRRLTALVETAA